MPSSGSSSHFSLLSPEERDQYSLALKRLSRRSQLIVQQEIEYAKHDSFGTISRPSERDAELESSLVERRGKVQSGRGAKKGPVGTQNFVGKGMDRASKLGGALKGLFGDNMHNARTTEGEESAQELFSKLPNPKKKFDPNYGWSRVPRDDMARVEDCVGCMFVWNQVEMDVGESKFDKVIQTSFTRNCLDAQRTPIFYPVVSL